MNSLVAAIRKLNPDEQRSDNDLTWLAGTRHPEVLARYPDALAEFNQMKVQADEAASPSLGQEVGRGWTRGVEGMEATGYGAAALAAGKLGAAETSHDWLLKAQEHEQAAAAPENAPSVPSLGDIHGAGDTAHYVAGEVGSILPSLGEAAVTSAAGTLVGGALGTAAEPGGGTVVGGAGGLIAGIVEKRAVASLISKFAKKEGEEWVAKQAGGALAKQEIEQLAKGEIAKSALSDTAKTWLAAESKGLAQKYGMEAANTLNFWAQSAGGIYNDLSQNKNVDPDTAINTAIYGGLAASLPAQVLPSYIAGKFIQQGPNTQAVQYAKNQFYGYLARTASEAAKTIPGGIAAMDMQEFATIAAEKYADPATRNEPWQKADWDRLKEASASGGIMGLMGAPMAALHGTGQKPPEDSPSPTPPEPPAVAPAATPPAPAPASPAAPPAVDPTIVNYAQTHWDSAADEGRRRLLGQTQGPSVAAVTWDQLTPEQQQTVAQSVMGNRLPEPPAPTPVPSVVPTTTATEPVVKPSEPVAEATQPQTYTPEKLPPDTSKAELLSHHMAADLAGLGYSTQDQSSLSEQERLDIVAKRTPKPEPIAPSVDAATLQNAALSALDENKDLGGGGGGEAVDTQSRSGLAPEPPESKVAPAPPAGTVPDTAAPAASPQAQQAVQDEQLMAQIAAQEKAAAFDAQTHRIQVGSFQFLGSLGEQKVGTAETRRGHKGETGMTRPYVFPVKNDDVLDDAGNFDPKKYFALGDELTADASPGASVSKTNTRRITSFLAPDGSVVTLPVYKITTKERGTTFFVGALQAGTNGTELRSLLKAGYMPLDSFYLGDAVHAKESTLARLTFLDRSTYEAALARPAKEKLASAQATMTAVESKMQERARGVEAEDAEVEATEAAHATESEAAQNVAAASAPASFEIEGTPVQFSKRLQTTLFAGIQAEMASSARVGRPLELVDAVENAMANMAKSRDANSLAGTKELRNLILSLTKDHDLEPVEASRAVFEKIADTYHDATASERPAEIIPGETRGPDDANRSNVTGNDRVNSGTIRPTDETQTAHGETSGGNPPGQSGQTGNAGNQVPDQSASGLRFGTPSPEFAPVASQKFKQAFLTVAQRLRNAGIEVALHNRIFDPLVKELVDAHGQLTKGQEGGVYNHAARTVDLVLHDVTEPTSSDLRTLIEETGHHVFATLPDHEQTAIIRAVGNLTDEEMGLGHYSKSANPNIQTEERLMSAVSHALVRDGFDPIRADTFAQHLVRFFKELYLRATMAIQKAVLGLQYDNPELAQRYFRNRLESFLAGDQERGGGFMDMFGGPKPTTAQESMWHGNQRPLFEHMGADGKPAYDFAPDDSMAATNFNIDALRFSTPGADDLSHSRFADVERLAAIYNHQADMLDRASQMQEILDVAGGDKAKARELLINTLNFVDPAAKKAKLATLKEQNGVPVQYNPNITIDQIKGKAGRDWATAKTAATVQRYLTKLARIRTDSIEELKRLNASAQRVLQEFDEAKEQHTSYPYLANRAGKAIRGEGQRLFNSIAGISKRQGVIEQQLKALDPTALVRDYADAFKNLFSGTQLKGERLFGYLDRLANDSSIDFTRPIAEIRAAMAGKPEFESLIQNTPESRALLATLVGFAKTHSRVMANLELRRLKDGAERAAIIQRLDTLKTQKQAFLESVANLSRTAKLENRVRQAYWDSLRAVKTLKRGIAKAEQRVKLADTVEPLFTKEHARLSGELALGADAVFGHGMAYNVPERADATSAEITKPTSPEKKTPVTQKKIALDAWGKVTNGDELEADLRKMGQFIAERDRQFGEGNDDAHDGVYQSIQRQFREITAYKNFTPKINIAQRLMVELAVSPVGKKVVGAFGTPTARMIERLINDYVNIRSLQHAEGERLGLKTGQLESKVLAFFPKDIQDARNFLRENIVSPSQKIMESQHDLEERYGSPDQAGRLHSAIFKRVENALLRDKTTASIVSQPGAINALRALLEHKKATDQYLNDLVRKAGTGVADPKLMVINPATGELETGIRAHLERGAFTFSRTMSQSFRTMVNALRLSGWIAQDGQPCAGSDLADAAKIYNDGPQGPARLRQIVQKYSHNPDHMDAVQRMFFGELAKMEYDAGFNGPKDADGITAQPADTQNIRQAHEESGGDLVSFAERLWDLEGGQGDKGQFVGDTLKQLVGYAKEANNLMQQFEPQTTGGHLTSVRNMSANAMINARTVEHLPGTWFDYHSFDQRSMSKMLERIASQSAFGRGQERLAKLFDTLHDEVATAKQKLNEKTAEIKAAHRDYTPKQIEKALIETFKPETYRNLTKMVANQKFVDEAIGDLSHFFRRDNSPDGTLRTMVRAAHLLGNLLVQQPGSAIIQLSKLLDMHLKYGASGSVVNASFRSGVAIGKELAASLAQAIGMQIFNDGEHHQRFVRLGLSDPGAFQHYRDAFIRLENEPRAAHLFRGAHHLMGVGLNAAGEAAQHTILRPFEPFTTVSTAADKAGVEGFWHLAERHAMRGIEYLRDNSEALADPSFKMTAETLGIKGAERDSFTRLTNDMSRWGMDYNDLVRDHIARNDGTIFTDDTYARLYSLMASEIANEGNIATLSASAYNNSVINFAMPLLGWSFRRMQQVADLRLNPEGKHSLKALGWGLAGLTVMGAGGLALSALVDEYSKRVLGKERNLRPVTGEPNAYQTALGVMENLNRIGTLGFFGEFANGLLNVGEGGDNRMFSVDDRVIAVQSALAIQSAISAWVNQDFNADYTHVVRPLASAMGGASLLQYIQIANNAFGLDNLEARTVARINAQNYLRVVGREMELDVRPPGGAGTGSSTPMSPHITHMELAAYKNNAADFQQAYLEALAQAKALGHDDPVDYVKRAFASRNPVRSVFRVPPTEAEYQAMLNNMGESGRRDVSEAVRLFNSFAQRLGIPAFDGKKPAVAKPSANLLAMPRFSLQDYRDKSAAFMGSAF